MDKLRNQLPDSSSGFFDDEAMSDLPSCVFANHHQINSSQMALNNLGMSNGQSVNNSLRLNTNNFKIQHFMHHSNEISDITATSSPIHQSFNGNIKGSRQHATRERKRTNGNRNAPNGKKFLFKTQIEFNFSFK